jgi:hypothetical protein
VDHNLYYLQEDGNMSIIVLHVDDLLITRDHIEIIHWLKNYLFSRFEMTELGLLNFVLGMELLSLHKAIFMCQCAYVINILDEF